MVRANSINISLLPEGGFGGRANSINISLLAEGDRPICSASAMISPKIISFVLTPRVCGYGASIRLRGTLFYESFKLLESSHPVVKNSSVNRIARNGIAVFYPLPVIVLDGKE